MKNNNAKFEDNRLIVPTPKGDIVVSIKDNGGIYPGIFVDFHTEDIKESARLYDEFIQLAMIEYNTEEKELALSVWNDPGSEDISHKFTYTEFLTYDEDFEILPKGTEVLYVGKRAFITGDDKQECVNGYKESLNYFIKFANENETYEDVLNRIITNQEDWYDVMEFWSEIIPITE